MKNLTILAISIFTIIGCSQNNAETTEEGTVAGRYGDTTFTSENAITMAAMLDSLSGNDSIYATVNGEIKAACQAKGCWMSMDANGQDMLVQFKDYGFFVPKNSAEHKATLRGWAYVDTLSVAEQVEIAKDAEKTAEEIAAISEPKVKLSFMADGVIIE
ncbi:MAG: hypothetical protein RLZZ337_967 [Bacteroidota bacterium]|jgi:hypothetical protein